MNEEEPVASSQRYPHSPNSSSWNSVDVGQRSPPLYELEATATIFELQPLMHLMCSASKSVDADQTSRHAVSWLKRRLDTIIVIVNHLIVGLFPHMISCHHWLPIDVAKILSKSLGSRRKLITHYQGGSRSYAFRRIVGGHPDLDRCTSGTPKSSPWTRARHQSRHERHYFASKWTFRLLGDYNGRHLRHI
jgi:hypothetical protein